MRSGEIMIFRELLTEPWALHHSNLTDNILCEYVSSAGTLNCYFLPSEILNTFYFLC